MKNERGDITTNLREIRSVINNIKLYVNKLNNKNWQIPRKIQVIKTPWEDLENMNRLITKVIKLVNKKNFLQDIPSPSSFTGEF